MMDQPIMIKKMRITDHKIIIIILKMVQAVVALVPIEQKSC